MFRIQKAVDILTEVIPTITRKIKRMEKIINEAPAGYITVSKRKNSIIYRWVYNSNGTHKREYIPKKNNRLLIKLSDKAFAIMELRTLKKCLKLITTFVSKCPTVFGTDLANELESQRNLLTSKATTLSYKNYAKQWLKQHPSDKKYKAEHKIFPTKEGSLVRSKSEVMISNELYDRDLTFVYEPRLTLCDGSVIHPDFLILHPKTLQPVYFEHCGMMDTPKYTKKFVKRMKAYKQLGIRLGVNLFCTFETSEDPLTSDQIAWELDLMLNNY